MKVLVACEESQAVTIEFRKLGHEAYSCDILDCSGGHPEWHLHGDCLNYLWARQWDLVMAHPPCTRLANSGVTWLAKRDLWIELKAGIEFFREFQRYAEYGNKIAIENPIPHKYAREGFWINEYVHNHKPEFVFGIGDYSQIIQPYQFGHAERKATCLWLYGLPELKGTNDVRSQMELLPKNQAQRIHYTSPGPERAKLRSKTFPGIAKAMAEQWG